MNSVKVKHELWYRGVLSWKLHAGQQRVYNSLRSLSKEVREAVVLISRRWGKSYLGVVMALEDCMATPGAQVFIVGPNLKQTRKIIAPLINEITADALPGLIKQTKSELLWNVGESQLIIGAFDTALESFRGLRGDAIYLEESGLAHAEEYEYTLRSVLRPTLMHSKGKIIHLTTPAVEIDHPLHTITIPQAEVNGAYYKYTIWDNPLLSNEDIAAEIKAMGGSSSIDCRRELFCEIVKDEESLIIPEFEPNDHIKQLTVPTYTYWQTSIDFGGSRDNHGLLAAYYDFERAKICFKGERFLPVNTGTDEIVLECERMEKDSAVKWLGEHPKRVCDAPGQTLVDLKRLGFKCSFPLKGKDSVLESINALRVAFRRNEIEIDPSCINLIAALKYGMWDKNRKDFVRSKALGHCDMIASLIYNFKHINKRNNPFPPHLGKHPHTHYINPNRDRDKENEEALESGFYGD